MTQAASYFRKEKMIKIINITGLEKQQTTIAHDLPWLKSYFLTKLRGQDSSITGGYQECLFRMFSTYGASSD